MKKISASELKAIIDEETAIVIKERYAEKELINEGVPVAAWVGTALTTILSTEAGRAKVADMLDALPDFLLNVCKKIEPDDANPELGSVLRKIGKTFCKGAVYMAGGAMFKIISKILRSMTDEDIKKVAEEAPAESEVEPADTGDAEVEDMEIEDDIDISSLNPFLSGEEEESTLNESRMLLLAGVNEG